MSCGVIKQQDLQTVTEFWYVRLGPGSGEWITGQKRYRVCTKRVYRWLHSCRQIPNSQGGQDQCLKIIIISLFLFFLFWKKKKIKRAEYYRRFLVVSHANRDLHAVNNQVQVSSHARTPNRKWQIRYRIFFRKESWCSLAKLWPYTISPVFTNSDSLWLKTLTNDTLFFRCESEADFSLLKIFSKSLSARLA